MRIGELAQASGTPIETIRFYEREGLLPAAPRTEGNYRIYTPAHAERLELMADADGVWRCRTVFNCVEACPRGINVTRAILEVTQAIEDRPA